MIWVNYNDLTATSGGIGVKFGEIIPFYGLNAGEWITIIDPESSGWWWLVTDGIWWLMMTSMMYN